MTAAIKSELWKLRSLPTPRWTAGIVGAFMLLGLLLVWLTGPGSGTAAVETSVGVPTWIASIVLGAWMIGVEYGQGTMRRTLSADSRRIDLVKAKLVVALIAAGGLTIAAILIAAPLFSIAASTHPGGSIPVGDTIETGIAGLFMNLVYAVVGFALALLTRSMAGGMTLALAFAFVIDSALHLIPDVGDYSLQANVIAITDALAPDQATATDPDSELGRAIPTVFAWVALLVAVATARFTRTDVE